MDGATEKMNCNIGQIFHLVISSNQKNWVDKINKIEFAINLSISKTTKFAPFEIAYGYMPLMIWQFESGSVAPPAVQQFAKQALINMAAAHDAIIECCVFQTYYANQ